MSTTEEPAVEMEGITKSYGDVPVLAGLDLEVPRGSLLALLGPNGAGKTTAVRILTTLLAPDGGRASVAGHDVVGEADTVRRLIGVTGQSASVDDLLTGRENLVMLADLLRLGGRNGRRRADELLDRLDLTGAADRRVRTYSGGTRRRLDLAASLIARPAVLFLDEPTTGLDPRSRLAIWALVRDLLTEGSTVLLTTQYLEEADQLADHVVVLHEGHAVADGSAAELKALVGRERLELRLAAGADLATARRVLGLGDGTAADGAVAGEDGRTVSVAVDDPDEVRRHLDRLAAAGIALDRMSVTEPTLDDAFLALTGSTPEVAA